MLPPHTYIQCCMHQDSVCVCGGGSLSDWFNGAWNLHAYNTEVFHALAPSKSESGMCTHHISMETG